MKKFLKVIGIGIVAAIVIKLLTIAIIMIAIKAREFVINMLDCIENIYKGAVYPFTTNKLEHDYLLGDAKDWEEEFN